MTAAGRLAGRCEHCRPAGIKVGQSAAPLSHLRRQLPLQGSHQTAGACKGSPARGAGCAARRRLKGAAPCGANIRPGHRAGAQRRGKSRRSSLCGCGGKVLPPRRDKGRAKCRTPQSPAVTAPLTGEPSNGRRLQRLPCKGSWLRRKAQTEGCRALRCKYPSGPSRRRAAPVFRHRAFCAGLPAGGAGALSGQEKSNIKGESVCPNCILSCPWPGGAAAFLKTALCSPSR